MPKDLNSVKELILENVTLGDILKADGKIRGLEDEEQFSCTFHGADRKKSARYYRDTDSSYCWTCKKKWDLFAYVGQKEGFSFADTIRYLVKKYNINVSKLPDIRGAHVRQRERTAVKLDQKKLVLGRIKQALMAVREDIDFEKYKRFVLAYMYLSYIIPDEKFAGEVEKMRTAMLESFGG